MITVENLIKTIRKNDLRGSKLTILKGVSLRVVEGSVTAIIGLNGAGKSTVIKTIMGFARATSGNVTIAPDKQIGYLPENPYYYDYLTFRELLWFSAQCFGLNPDLFKRRMEEVSCTVGMAEHLDKRLGSFSKGMTQRAGIAAAIIHNPDLVIFDEPMSGLDPLGREMVFDLIKQLQADGKTVLFSSHILSDVERLCDRVVMLHQGEVVHILSRDDLLLAQKDVEIMLRYEPEVIRSLDELELHYMKYDVLVSAFTETSLLETNLKNLAEKGIEIVTVRSSEATLENIFSEIVRQRR